MRCWGSNPGGPCAKEMPFSLAIAPARSDFLFKENNFIHFGIDGYIMLRGYSNLEEVLVLLTHYSVLRGCHGALEVTPARAQVSGNKSWFPAFEAFVQPIEQCSFYMMSTLNL